MVIIISASELIVDEILARYEYIGGDKNHIMAAQLALLELALDRGSLLCEAAIQHSSISIKTILIVIFAPFFKKTPKLIN